eukprot:1501689-Rhodomonas_salina.1
MSRISLTWRHVIALSAHIIADDIAWAGTEAAWITAFHRRSVGGSVSVEGWYGTCGRMMMDDRVWAGTEAAWITPTT